MITREEKPGGRTPEEDVDERPLIKPTSLCQRLTFSFLNNLVYAGNRKPYDEQMLMRVENHFQFAEPNAHLNQILNNQKRKELRFSTLIKFSFPLITQVSIFCFINAGFGLSTAYFTSKLIDWIQEKKPDFLCGGFLTLLVISLMNFKVLCFNWYYKIFYETEKHLINGLRVSRKINFLGENFKEKS